MLAYVTSQPRTTRTARADAKSLRSGRRVWSFGLAGATAVCVLVSLLVVFQPWGGGPQVHAQTPAMLHFANVGSGQTGQGGEPAKEESRPRSCCRICRVGLVNFQTPPIILFTTSRSMPGGRVQLRRTTRSPLNRSCIRCDTVGTSCPTTTCAASSTGVRRWTQTGTSRRLAQGMGTRRSVTRSSTSAPTKVPPRNVAGRRSRTRRGIGARG